MADQRPLEALVLVVDDAVFGSFDQSGDDRVIKPFDVEELRARIRALRRRSDESSARDRAGSKKDTRIREADLTLDLNTCQLEVDGETWQLTPTSSNCFTTG